MLTPLEIRTVIDSRIAEHSRFAGPFDPERITDAVLSTLPPEDRRGMERGLLCLIVMARVSLFRRQNDTAAAAA